MTIRTTCLALATGLAFLAVQANAGGPVIVEDMLETAPMPRERNNAVPLAILGAAVLLLILSGGGNGSAPCVDGWTPDPTPEPEPPTGGC